jgi:hypothetical protein
MTGRNSLNLREFLFTALGAAVSLSVLPKGHRLIREPADIPTRFAPFQYPPEFIWDAATSAYRSKAPGMKTAKANRSGTVGPTP